MVKMELQHLLQRAVAGEKLSDAELELLLGLHSPQEVNALLAAAYQVKVQEVGRVVYLRGLIEISNICRKDCYYCGIRHSNSNVERFALTKAEIVDAALEAQDFNYGSVVLQSGERNDERFVDFITDVVTEIKRRSNNELGITLSLGEQSEATYREWLHAGAHRYLLRIETSNEKLYSQIHPEDHRFADRLHCLEVLKKLKFQFGTGVMIGLPNQSLADLVADVRFFEREDVDMLGMGPFLPHHDAPLGQGVKIDLTHQLNLALKMIAVCRLVLRSVNIASTTALQALDRLGRERGLLAGANIIMPNVTASRFRPNYQLYDNKPGIDENSLESRLKLEKSIAQTGETIGYGAWGDSPHFRHRTEKNIPSSVIMPKKENKI